MEHEDKEILERLLRESEEHSREIARILHIVRRLERDERPQPSTPTGIQFEEITMNATAAGQSQVFTGVLSPAGSAYPAGTTFTITSNDSAVVPIVDATGLIVSVTYPDGWVESTTTPLVFRYASSVFVPVAPGNATEVTATITPSAPVAGLGTPNSIGFTQTT